MTMRLSRLALFFALSWAAWGQCSNTTYGAFKCVQTGRNAGSNITTVSLGGASTGGNLLTLMSESNSGTTNTISSIACGANSFTFVVGATAGGDSAQRTEVWYVANAASCTTATVTWGTNNDYHALYLTEWSGAATVAPLDGHGSSTGNSGTAATGSFAITSGDLVVGAAIFEGQAAPTPGTGFTQIDTDTHSNIIAGAIAASTTNPTETNTSAAWTISAAAFKVPGGATHGLFEPSLLNGVSTGGPFFANPIGFRPLVWVLPVWLWRKRVALRRGYVLHSYNRRQVFVRPRLADPALARIGGGGPSVRQVTCLAAPVERPDCPVRSIYG